MQTSNTNQQRLQPRRRLGPPRGRAQQSSDLQPGAGAPAHGHARRRRGGQQRGGDGAEAAAVLAQAGAAVLVGGRGAAGRRGRAGAAEGVDPEGVDAGDERYWAALTWDRRGSRDIDKLIRQAGMVSFVIRPREKRVGGKGGGGGILFYDRMGANGVERVDCRIYSTAQQSGVLGPCMPCPFFPRSLLLFYYMFPLLFFCRLFLGRSELSWNLFLVLLLLRFIYTVGLELLAVGWKLWACFGRAGEGGGRAKGGGAPDERVAGLLGVG